MLSQARAAPPVDQVQEEPPTWSSAAYCTFPLVVTTSATVTGPALKFVPRRVLGEGRRRLTLHIPDRVLALERHYAQLPDAADELQASLGRIEPPQILSLVRQARGVASNEVTRVWKAFASIDLERPAGGRRECRRRSRGAVSLAERPRPRASRHAHERRRAPGEPELAHGGAAAMGRARGAHLLLGRRYRVAFADSLQATSLAHGKDLVDRSSGWPLSHSVEQEFVLLPFNSLNFCPVEWVLAKRESCVASLRRAAVGLSCSQPPCFQT
jgi:hypothetical protein